MKKKITPFAIFLSLFILLSCSVFGLSSLENTSVVGNDVEADVLMTESFSLNSELVGYQENNADNEVQLGDDEINVDVKKKRILGDVSFLWKLIAGEFRMILELIKIIFYAIEIYLFMFFMFKIIPNLMLKIREVIVKWYQEKKEL
jgi:hypothetical protein